MSDPCPEGYSITEGLHKGLSRCGKPAGHPETEHKSKEARWLSLEDWPRKEKT